MDMARLECVEIKVVASCPGILSVARSVNGNTVSQEQSALINLDLHATQLVIFCLIEISYSAVAPLACTPDEVALTFVASSCVQHRSRHTLSSLLFSSLTATKAATRLRT
jgi:hypothetical protein